MAGAINIRAEQREIDFYLVNQLNMHAESDRGVLISTLKKDQVVWVNYLNNARRAKQMN